MTLEQPIETLPGIGPQRALILRKASLKTLGDLLKKHLPFRFEDRTQFLPIRELQEGRQALIQGTVLVAGGHLTARKRFPIFELAVADQSGRLAVKFFNQPYLKRVFRKGQEVVFFGTPRYDDYSHKLTLLNPEFEILGGSGTNSMHSGRIVPIYRRIGTLYPRVIRQLIYRLLEGLSQESVPEVLPEEVLRRYGFPGRLEALREIHFPEPDPSRRNQFLQQLEARETPAHQRLVFEEFYRFQLGLQILRGQREAVTKGRRVTVNPDIRETIKSVLPFHPTAAQKRVLKEIVDDLSSSRVMSRLVQGDVGSGKTIVALQAMLVVMENGFQTALMAPTEILAEQHFQNLTELLEPTPYRVGLLSKAVKGADRRRVLKDLLRGEIHLLVGTHAIFQKSVKMANLGMVVIDEQHRFGVIQRLQLMEKGDQPDTLVMTATPIPRTLALTLYGDLDLSVIDELPPGRRPVETLIKEDRHRPQVYEGIRRQLKEGRQAYLVYPLVEESQKVELKAATEMSQQLQQDVFPEFQLGLLHGRLKPREKEQLMRAFVAGEIHLLVATTVIEVGIDVPNASLMIIEHADRFGLSQLHQLRGRVGRGPYRSYCILMTEGYISEDARERLLIMRKSNDGFRIAEKDLELRGPGEFLGTRQSGMPEFLFANLARDQKLLELARTEAARQLERLSATDALSQENLAGLLTQWRQEFGLSEVG